MEILKTCSDKSTYHKNKRIIKLVKLIQRQLHENSDCYTYQCAVKTIQSILYIVTSIT